MRPRCLHVQVAASGLGLTWVSVAGCSVRVASRLQVAASGLGLTYATRKSHKAYNQQLPQPLNGHINDYSPARTMFMWNSELYTTVDW
jgi:hypothetical protein